MSDDTKPGPGPNRDGTYTIAEWVVYRTPEWIADVHPDAPLLLWYAMSLPELGGQFDDDDLRNAILAGELPGTKRRGRYYVTRNQIREWGERTAVRPRTAGTTASPGPVPSPRTDGEGSSGIAAAAARATLSALRDRLRGAPEDASAKSRR